MKYKKQSAVILAAVIGLSITTTMWGDAGPKDPVIPIATKIEAVKELTQENDSFLLEEDGFHNDEVGRYYIKDGSRIINEWIEINQEKYHTDEYGYIKSGWYYDTKGSLWYYFDSVGKSITKWLYDKNTWYFLDDGTYLTGWHQLESNGLTTWYCFSENGKLYQDRVTPDGYRVDMSGAFIEPADIENEQINDDNDSNFVWDKDRSRDGTLSGLIIAGQPVEFYMLCIAGETSGLSNENAVRNGDNSCAYGVCQLDYRYDLVDFMESAYQKHPALWSGFSQYTSYRDGNSALRGNGTIGNVFMDAMAADYETAISDQLGFMREEYWDDFKTKMNVAGFKLDERHIAVSAALFSVNVNCGSQAGVFIKNLTPDMSDETMIKEIYRLRNTVFANQNVGSAKKGTTTRYRVAEHKMALDLLYGYITVDSDANYGGGVEWHGNPFIDTITTTAQKGKISFAGFDSIPEESLQTTAEETKEVVVKESEVSETEIDGIIVSEMEESTGSPVISVPKATQAETAAAETTAAETSAVIVAKNQ